MFANFGRRHEENLQKKYPGFWENLGGVIKDLSY